MLLNFDTFSLQPIAKEDYWNLCDFVVANEDRFKTFFPLTLAQNLTPELSKVFAEKKAKAFKDKEEFLFTIKVKGEQHLVGLVYIKELDWKINQGEFAYCIGYQYEGKGIITRAIKKLSHYAFETLDLKTLQIISHKSNVASIKVALNCNFTWKKTLIKSYTPPNSEPLDMELYELYSR